MPDDRRQTLRRDEDRELLVQHDGRIDRLERDVSRLVDSTERRFETLDARVDRGFDELDLKYPTFDRVAKDFVPREEHHQHSLDRRSRLMLGVATASVLLGPVISVVMQVLVR